MKKVQMEIVPNPDILLFHTDFKMSQDRVGQMIEGEMTTDEKKALSKSSDSTKKLTMGIMKIEGIKTFSLNRYEVQVEKVPLFDWFDIEPQIVSLIQLAGKETTGEEVDHIKQPIIRFLKCEDYNELGGRIDEMLVYLTEKPSYPPEE